MGVGAELILSHLFLAVWPWASYFTSLSCTLSNEANSLLLGFWEDSVMYVLLVTLILVGLGSRFWSDSFWCGVQAGGWYILFFLPQSCWN